MKTYKRTCIKEFEITAKNGDYFKAVRGKKYLTSNECKDGTVTVFKNFWIKVPINNFAEVVDEPN